MKEKIYIDTSVVGGCFDEEFEEWSNQLFEEFIHGIKIAVVSDITYREVELAPQEVQDKLSSIPDENKEEVLINNEVENLASEYIKVGAVSAKYFEDALHIAIATLHKVDVLVSWNFKHIVNIERIRKYNSVNLMLGHGMIEIRTPREILKDKDYEE